MNQANLFERALETPIARRSDPRTSHLAAREVTESGQREGQLRRVLELVQKYPLCTSAELARKGGMDRYQVARRLPELEHAHYVTKMGVRACGITGKKAVTWITI